MCEIVRKRSSDKLVYLDIIDDDMYMVKKMKIDDYKYAASFHNPDFLKMVSHYTDDRDFDDAARAAEFA